LILLVKMLIDLEFSTQVASSFLKIGFAHFKESGKVPVASDAKQTC